MELRIALAGNPNCGKTTLFNALTGSNQYVGNWPGVTVEKKEGKLKGQDGVVVIDLPGIYSLSPYTLEEVVARNYLIGEKPDVILDIVDGTNLERNLYLTTQMIEIGIPVVVAINMMDIVRKNGDKIDIEGLSKELGCPVVEISALKEDGTVAAAEAAIKAAKEGKSVSPLIFSGHVEHALAHIEEAAVHHLPEAMQRWYSIKIFERDIKVLEELSLDPAVLEHLEKDIVRAETKLDDDADALIISERYNYIDGIVARCYKRKNEGMTLSDKIDRVVTNRWLALPIFGLIIFGIYYISVTTVGTWITDWTNDTLFGGIISPWVNDALLSIGCAEWLRGLIVEGIVGGVGAVLGFVPQILLLFVFLGFLEGCGYMSRVAFVMDRMFRKFGLSGKSFIPMLIGTGCSVPGIMASRTIENEADRRMTIMTTSFIPCGAKIPVISMVAGALFGKAWWVAPSAYFIGMAAVVVSGIILKKTKLFAGDVAPFVMELPAYHMPTPKNLFRTTWERGWSFIKKAGTIILLSTMILWFLQGFGFEGGAFGMVEDANNSILSYIGKPVAFLFIPLGFGFWQAAVSVFTGLIAKENIIATLGVLYGAAEVSETGAEYWGLLANDMSALAGFSFLVFNLLCAPCFAAMGAIRREMNNGKWTAFAITYQCVFAYAVSLCVYQLGSIFTGNANIIGIMASIIVIGVIGYFLFRPNKHGFTVKKEK